MKKNINYVIYILLIISTIGVIFIVFKNIQSPFAYRFVIVYVCFLILSAIYFIFTAILNARNLNPAVLRKRLLRFSILFVSFGALNFGADYFFRPSKVDLLREFSISFGLAIGITFFDLIFVKNRS